MNIQINDLAPLTVDHPAVDRLSEYSALVDRIYNANTRIARLMLHQRSGKLHGRSATRDMTALAEQLRSLQAQADALGRHF